MAVLGAVTALLVAVGAILAQIRGLRRQVDGRLTELLALTRQHAVLEGHMAGRAEMLEDRAAAKRKPARRGPDGLERENVPWDNPLQDL